MKTCTPDDSGQSFENSATTPDTSSFTVRHITPSRAAIAALRSTLLYVALCAAAILAGLLIAHLLNGQRGTERSIALAGNELLYRACAREAMLKHIPVKPYPQESERISLVREGDRVLQRLERLEADVINMRVENGCEVSLQHQVSMEPLQDNAIAAAPIMPTSHSAAANEEIIVEAIDPRPARRPHHTHHCNVSRDMSMQSHFMLLNQCLPDRSQTAQPETQQSAGRSRANFRVAT